jgi:hypothetical protein
MPRRSKVSSDGHQPDPMTKSEREALLRALRANTKVAKTVVLGLGPKLKADFEIQLKTLYPPEGDPIWKAEIYGLIKDWEARQARVNARSEELGISHRFRPSLHRPGWNYGEHHYFSEVRNEMRRLIFRLTRSLNRRLSNWSEIAPKLN